jgi:DNA-binding beta-propeller fold protein YncE
VKSITQLTKGVAIIALTTLIGSAPAVAGTFIYVSNADDSDIGVYSVQTDGSLKPGERAKAANLVYPMAVSPDRRFLYAVARSKPYSAFIHAIDPNTGALRTLSVSALAESFPYISLDKTGRYLFGASYGSHLISQRGRRGRASGSRAAAGDTGGPQRALDPHGRATDSCLSPRSAATRYSSSRSIRRPGIVLRTRRQSS